MGELSEFSPAVRLFLKGYRWRSLDPVPWTPLAKPLADCRVALMSSAGFYGQGQAPFDESKRGGDHSFRILPADVPLDELANNHRSDSFDHEPMLRDPNLALPLDRMREFADDGRIGSLAPRAISFMGSLTSTRRFVRETAPEVATCLADDAVDVALLVPV
jgi:D-proline reductase (dithiol) PrdB